MPYKDQNEQKVSIGDLYPQLNAEQRAEAEHYLSRYLEVVQGIFERRQKLTER